MTNENPVEQLLSELVAIPSVTGNFAANDNMLDFIGTFLSERGMHISQKSFDNYGTLVATTRRTKVPAVMLVGHTDVVDGGKEQFHLTEHSGKLFGRGTRDMKGSIAGYMAVVDRLQEQLDEYDFGIMLISDEETIDVGIIRLLEEGYRPKSVVLLDGGESWQLEKLAKGALYVRAFADGKTAHGSRPWLGDSASFKLAGFLAEFQKDFELQGPTTDTLNISNIAAGTGAFNQIPDYAEATLDIRLMDSDNRPEILDRLTDLCEKHGCQYEEIVYFPVLKHDMKNPYLVSFADAITKVTGKVYPPTIAYGASDACRFDELGIPCAVTYPVSGGHHSDGEWIDKQSLYDLVDILTEHLNQTARTRGKIQKILTAA